MYRWHARHGPMTVLLVYFSQEEGMTRARDSIWNRQVNSCIRPYKPLTITDVSQTVPWLNHQQDSSKQTGKTRRLGTHQQTSGRAHQWSKTGHRRNKQLAHTQLSLLSYPWSTAALQHTQRVSVRTSRAQENETRTSCTSGTHPQQSCCTGCPPPPKAQQPLVGQGLLIIEF
jgi:hypothetical protein